LVEVKVSKIYKVVRNAYGRVMVDREFQRKTNELIQEKIGMENLQQTYEFFEINENTIKKIKENQSNYNTRVINLVKSIEKIAEENSDDPFLIGLRERAILVEERYEDRQISTHEALEEIKNICEDDIKRKKEQAEKGFDGLTFFIYRTLLDKDIKNADEITKQIKAEFINNPNWMTSEKEMRDLRRGTYYAVLNEEDDIDKAAAIVEDLFNHLFIAYNL